MALPRDSYLQAYFTDLYDVLRVGPPLYFVVPHIQMDPADSDINTICSVGGCNDVSFVNEVRTLGQQRLGNRSCHQSPDASLPRNPRHGLPETTRPVFVVCSLHAMPCQCSHRHSVLKCTVVVVSSPTSLFDYRPLDLETLKLCCHGSVVMPSHPGKSLTVLVCFTCFTQTGPPQVCCR